jgi:hypothetical protein
MQPNQQDPYRQPNQQQPYQVPEYLHMEPVVLQPHKNKRKRIFVVIAAAVLVVAVAIGSLVFAMTEAGDSEEKLYKAMSTLMNTSYIHREITISKQGLDGAIKISADSDFSVPSSPMSMMKYGYEGLLSTEKNAKNESVSGEMVTIDAENYAGRVVAAPDNLLKSLGVQPNKWYQNTLNKLPKNNTDIFGVYIDTNSPLGSMIMGNYSEKKPDTIISVLRASNIYEIKSVQSVDQGKKYIIKQDYKKLNDAIIKINEEVGTKLRPLRVESTNAVEISVSNTTGRVVEILETIKQDNLQVTVITKLSYPDKLSIKAPIV